MDDLPPSATWSRLHDRFYSTSLLYDMEWKNIDLAKFTVIGAPFGGPIALKRDDRKMQRMRGVSLSERPDIYLFTASGLNTAKIAWDCGRVVGMGWSDKEELMVVIEDGNVRVFDVNGELLRQFSMGVDAQQQGVRDCRIYGTGIVVMTEQLQFFAVTSVEEGPRVRRLADVPGLTEPPTSWAVIEPRFAISRNVEVLVAVGQSVFVVDATEAQDQQFQGGPVTQIAVSPNGKLLALFGDTGFLWVVSADFKKKLSEFNTKSKVAPLQLVWCGTDSVVAFWENMLFMIGPRGDWIKYPYDECVHLVPELDGVRIVSGLRHELLRLVPKTVEDIFKIGSTAPSAILYDAQDHFEKESPKADDLIRGIKPMLSQAVDACIEAAGFELSPRTQRQLLKAASYGKCFLDFYNSDSFVDMCQTLRVLNTVREYTVGIPLTHAQLLRLSPRTLRDRLVVRRQYAVAFRMCEYLKMKVDSVLVHWACVKVQQSEDDAILARDIIARLGETRGVSYADIARAAHHTGKPGLATLLLEQEPKSGDQVPLLMNMDEDDLALVKAMQSGDSDLVFLVIMHLKRKLSLGDFLRTLHNKPAAVDLFKQYCREHDPELLKDYYYQEENKEEMCLTQLKDAYAEKSLEKRLALLKVAYGTLHKTKENPFLADAIEEQVKLLAVQKELEASAPGNDFLGFSVTDTIYRCLLLNFPKRAQELRKTFGVPDVRFWWIKVRACAKVQDWKELDTFVKSKSKSPIGYQPMVDFCIAEGAPRPEIKKYIAKLAVDRRVVVYLDQGYYTEAMESALSSKDESLLEMIRTRAASSHRGDIVQDIDRIRAQMK